MLEFFQSKVKTLRTRKKLRLENEAPTYVLLITDPGGGLYLATVLPSLTSILTSASSISLAAMQKHMWFNFVMVCTKKQYSYSSFVLANQTG